MEDLHHAIQVKEQATNSHTASPSIRIQAAHYCSDLLIRHNHYQHAKVILRRAVELLPQVSPRQLSRSDAQFNISQFSHVTSRAVSLSLADGDDLYKTLQLLELGRGILANLQLEVRSDITYLATAHPDLAHKFLEL